MKKDIYFLLATQHTNLGDLLINKMLIDEISKYGNIYLDSEGTTQNFLNPIMSNENVFSIKEISKSSLKRKSFLKALINAKDFKYFIVAAGPDGHISDFKSIQIQLFLTFVNFYLKINGLKIFRIGKDLTLNKEKSLDFLFKKLNNRFLSKYLVRSNPDFQRGISYNFKRIQYMPDLAFLFDAKISENKETVLISFRDLKDENNYNKILNFLSEALPVFKETNLEIIFFYQVESDKSFNKKLFQSLNINGSKWIDHCIWYDEISSIYSNAKYVLSNRLHVLLLGMVHHSVPIALLNPNQKTSKINNIFSSFGVLNELVNPISMSEIDFKYLEYFNMVIKQTENNKKLCRSEIQNLFK